MGSIILINYFVYRWNRTSLRIVRRQLSSSRSPSIAHFAETAQGASTIRSFSKEDSFIRRFAEVDQYYLDRKLTAVRKLTGFSFQMNGISSLLFLFTGFASLGLLSQGKISLGSVGVAFGLIVLSGNTVQMFFEWLAQFEEAMIGVERMDDYLRKPLEPGNALPSKSVFETGHPRSPPASKTAITRDSSSPVPAWLGISQASIEFKNVSFRYHDQQPWILQNINFRVEPGEHFGIIGSTGSGKSTLIQILFHLYPLQKGEVLIQDQSLRLDGPKTLGSLDSFRRAMSYISQDPTLFQGTLRDNLDMSGSLPNDEIRRALTQVGLDHWPLDRHLEEKGKNLSSGERQLVCMARCLLQQSPIVIMDEATSFVDPQSEEIMVRATQEYFKSRTQIIIAHRLSTLVDCHRILWLERGQIKELGPSAIILAKMRGQQNLWSAKFL